jgi:hypothetical protein
VQKSVPQLYFLLESFPKTARIELRSAPEATTQALQLEPGCTAERAAPILEAIPPRPVKLKYLCELQYPKKSTKNDTKLFNFREFGELINE